MNWFKGGILAGTLILFAAGAGGVPGGIRAETPTNPINPMASPDQSMAMNTGAVASVSAQAAGSADVMVSQNPTLGAILTDPQGMTLYTRTTDFANTSTCTGNCLNSWPPLQPSADMMNMAMPMEDGSMMMMGMMSPQGASGTLGVMMRDDGTMQETYNDWPLYHFARDAAPGDTNGQGVGGFTVAMP